MWPTGYTLEKHAEEARGQSGIELPLEQMKHILRESFSDLRRYLFPDILPFLREAKRNGVRLYLLSFGDYQWQNHKVLASNLVGYFDEVFFTAKEGGKATLIQEHGGGSAQRIVVVDNNPDELDLVKDVTPEAETYWMNRVPENMRVPADELSRLKFLEARKYLEKTPSHQHIPCRRLDDVTSRRAKTN